MHRLFDRLAVSRGGSEGGRERTTLSLCLEASHLAPHITHVADWAGAAIIHGIMSAAMQHPLIDFAGNSIAVNVLFEKYYGINDNGNGNDDNKDSGEGTTVIRARVLGGRRGRDEVARNGLHGSNCLASTSLLKGLVFD